MSDYNNENIFSKRLRAGKRRTYFFDVRTTKNNDYFVTLTESKKRFDGEGYDRHKIFLYKEDFNKFVNALNETIDHIKTELMPDFDFDAFNHDEYDENTTVSTPVTENSSTSKDTLLDPATSESPKNESAEELSNSIKEEVSFTDNKEVENPSANDEAQTW